MSSATNITLIQNIYAAFGRGDVPTIMEYLAEDIDWGIEAGASSEVPWHGTGTGKKFALEFFEALGKECEFPRFEPSGFVASEDAVFCLLTFEVKLRKNGKKSLNNVVHYFAIKNGKIAKWRGTEDTAQTKALWNS